MGLTYESNQSLQAIRAAATDSEAQDKLFDLLKSVFERINDELGMTSLKCQTAGEVCQQVAEEFISGIWAREIFR